MTSGTSLERAFYLAKSAVHAGKGMFTRLQDSKPLLFLVKDLIAIFVFPDFEVRSRNFDTLTTFHSPFACCDMSSFTGGPLRDAPQCRQCKQLCYAFWPPMLIRECWGKVHLWLNHIYRS
jgi:hypothetical protein